MAEAMQGLRQLADVLNVETARLSGDPQRLQLALGESQSRKLQEVNNLIDAEIDKLDMPESQKRLLKALSPQQKYQAIYGEEKKKTVADYKAYLAEKKLKGIPFTPQDKALENYLTKTDPIDQLTDVIVQQQLAGLGIGGGVGSTPDPSGLAEFPSLEAAKKAGLKTGDQFRGTDGNVYRLP